ncbi:MAG: hypothetical protein ACRYG2_16110 [Janthinobacterium lividum]
MSVMDDGFRRGESPRWPTRAYRLPAWGLRAQRKRAADHFFVNAKDMACGPIPLTAHSFLSDDLAPRGTARVGAGAALSAAQVGELGSAAWGGGGQPGPGVEQAEQGGVDERRIDVALVVEQGVELDPVREQVVRLCEPSVDHAVEVGELVALDTGSEGVALGLDLAQPGAVLRRLAVR